MTEWFSLKVSRKNYEKLNQIQAALNKCIEREKAKLSLDETLAIILLAGGTQFIDSSD